MGYAQNKNALNTVQFALVAVQCLYKWKSDNMYSYLSIL